MQNVVDHVPQRTLPHETEPVLTLVRNETQEDYVVNGEEVQHVVRSPVESEIPLISVARNNEQVQVIDDGTMAATLPEHSANLSADVSIGGEASATAIPEVPIMILLL